MLGGSTILNYTKLFIYISINSIKNMQDFKIFEDGQEYKSYIYLFSYLLRVLKVLYFKTCLVNKINPEI